MALLTCQNASFGYDGKAVVSGLTFAISGGDYLCVVGENGSGKSTLIKGLLRLKTPLEGSIQPGDGLLSSDIGYMPQQDGAKQGFPAGALEIVMSGLLARRGILPFYTRADKQKAKDNMTLLKCWDLRDRCYGELSGGQQRRVLLARALCGACRLLILDEPTSGLDPDATRDFYNLLTVINLERGVAIVMVSHDIHSAVKNASHILHLQRRQLFFGTRDNYTSSSLGRSYLHTGGEAVV